MTTRYNALTVVLDRDIRDDDAEALLTAIRMLRGVLTVQPHEADVDSLVAQQRARYELERRILDALRDPKWTPS